MRPTGPPANRLQASWPRPRGRTPVRVRGRWHVPGRCVGRSQSSADLSDEGRPCPDQRINELPIVDRHGKKRRGVGRERADRRYEAREAAGAPIRSSLLRKQDRIVRQGLPTAKRDRPHGPCLCLVSALRCGSPTNTRRARCHPIASGLDDRSQGDGAPTEGIHVDGWLARSLGPVAQQVAQAVQGKGAPNSEVR